MTTIATKPKIIGLATAMTMLVESKIRVQFVGKDVPAVQVSEPFTLVVVESGNLGSSGEAGDWIVWHPDQYPTIVSNAVMESGR